MVHILLKIIPFKRNYIIFESYPELDGSPWMIYKELVKRGFDKKYKLVWFVDANYKSSKEIKTIAFFGKWNIFQKLYGCFIIAKAKAIIDSNRYVKKINSKTFRLHTRHGAPLKNDFHYSSNLGNVDAVLSLSENLKEIEEKMYPSAKGKLVSLGYPTNDRLFKKCDLYENGFWEELTSQKKKYNKIIGWLPTYRQHRDVGIKATFIHPFGVPLIKEKSELDFLNKILQENNSLLAIQMHHAQANNFSEYNYSNIVLINQSLKQKKSVSTINLMHNFDAMITDYSSAYHEYLLLNRPIGLSIDDYDSYSINPGFSLDYFDWIKGEFLKDSNDLAFFIKNVIAGVDSANKKRNEALRKIHKFIDDCSTKRVVDFICDRASLN